MMRDLPDSLKISTPDQWLEFPVDAKDHDEFRRAVDERLRAEEADVAVRRAAELFLRNAELFAADQNVVLAGGVIASDGDDPEVPVFASVVVSTLSREALGTDVPLLPDVVMAAFANGQEPAHEGLTYAHLEPPADVTIAGSRAVRLCRLMTASRAGEADRVLYLESYIVPVADGDGLINMQFTTTAVRLAREFSELFTAIANTLRVVYPEDPTVELVGSDG